MTDHEPTMRHAILALAIAILLPACRTSEAPAADPLPSWCDGLARERIVEFVEDVSDPNSPYFVPAAERIAVFDNDGTLWSEQPAYFQLLFAIDRVKALAAAHPEWQSQPVFQAAIAGDLTKVGAAGEDGLMQLVLATHTGMTTDEFRQTVADWIVAARHPARGTPYTQLVYQPMLELLTYLRGHGFQTWIVSGGGVDFIRAWAERVYGIPPEQIVGSRIAVKFELRDGVPVLVLEPKLEFVDDKHGKPVGIHQQIGRRPILAFGNSDGDLQMLQWTMAGDGPHLAALVHHTDREREWAYDRDSHVGKLDQALDAALEKGWLVVDMAQDWSAVFPSAAR